MAQSLTFTVRRQEPVLVAPSEPTPYEFKNLSDIDNQGGLRGQPAIVFFYRRSNRELSVTGHDDPAKVIKGALAKALVFYYPFAGRLREERPGQKLVVECTAEGVLFIEADADVRLDQFGERLQPPFPCFEELLFDVEGSGGIINCPLLLIQVTRLRCGGFVLAIRLNHVMSDAYGLNLLFLTAVAEIARGRESPTVQPVWKRELLDARNPPYPTGIQPNTDNLIIIPQEDIILRTFFFGPKEISSLKMHIPPAVRNKYSTFEILSGCIWRSRTIALEFDPDEEVRVVCTVGVWDKLDPPLPAGYYGNAISHPVAKSPVEKICANLLDYAVELVHKLKSEARNGSADLMVVHEQRLLRDLRSISISDVTRVGFSDVDFGWGRPVYAGPACPLNGIATFFIQVKDGIVVPVRLPRAAMERFATEIEKMTREQTDHRVHSDANSIPFNKSAL